MGESSVDAPIADNTVGDLGTTGVATLQVSVSFSRFENESLSWEKWSTFPTNKHLKEVEKCSTIGSVAQKKAYFEAHYKKIAATKSEPEDHNKRTGVGPVNHVDSKIQRDLASHFSIINQDLDVDKLDDQESVGGLELEKEVTISKNEMSTLSSAQEDEQNNNIIDINENMHLPPLVKDTEDEARALGSQRVQELPLHIDNARFEVPLDKEEKVKSEKQLKSRKATTAKKATNTTVPRALLLSTPKLSRPALSKSTMSEPRALPKKEYSTSPLTSRKATTAEARKGATISLHMSLSLGPATEPAPTTAMRKPLIREKMGDKDIVKRAFKAFHNFDHISSSNPSKPALTSQIRHKETGSKVSAVINQKNIEGVKRSPQNSQPALRKTSNSPRFQNGVGADQRNGKSVSSPSSFRNHDKPDSRKELIKKPVKMVSGKAAERVRLQPKVKKEAEIKRLPHNGNKISGTHQKAL